jgi:hypothetical protein
MHNTPSLTCFQTWREYNSNFLVSMMLRRPCIVAVTNFFTDTTTDRVQLCIASGACYLIATACKICVGEPDTELESA